MGAEVSMDSGQHFGPAAIIPHHHHLFNAPASSSSTTTANPATSTCSPLPSNSSNSNGRVAADAEARPEGDRRGGDDGASDPLGVSSSSTSTSASSSCSATSSKRPPAPANIFTAEQVGDKNHQPTMPGRAASTLARRPFANMSNTSSSASLSAMSDGCKILSSSSNTEKSSTSTSSVSILPGDAQGDVSGKKTALSSRNNSTATSTSISTTAPKVPSAARSLSFDAPRTDGNANEDEGSLSALLGATMPNTYSPPSPARHVSTPSTSSSSTTSSSSSSSSSAPGFFTSSATTTTSTSSTSKGFRVMIVGNRVRSHDHFNSWLETADPMGRMRSPGKHYSSYSRTHLSRRAEGMSEGNRFIADDVL